MIFEGLFAIDLGQELMRTVEAVPGESVADGCRHHPSLHSAPEPMRKRRRFAGKLRIFAAQLAKAVQISLQAWNNNSFMSVALEPCNRNRYRQDHDRTEKRELHENIDGRLLAQPPCQRMTHWRRR